MRALEGKTAIVTGASSGIGAATARSLAAAGARVAVGARRTDRLAAIASKFAVRGFTYALREDLLGRPIHITTVDPGLVETEFSLVRFRGDAETAKRIYEGLEAMTPEDIAECVLFAVTRPPHVNVTQPLAEQAYAALPMGQVEIVVKALAQSSGGRIVRSNIDA